MVEKVKGTGTTKKAAGTKGDARPMKGRAIDGAAPGDGRERPAIELEPAPSPDRASFLELEAIILATTKDREITPRFSVLDASVVSIRLAERAQIHRALFAAIDEHSPGALDAFERLEKVARALRFIQTQLNNAQADDGAARIPEALVTEGDSLRARMLRVIDFVLGDDPKIAAAYERIRQGLGHRDRANDLEELSSIYEERADAIADDRIRYRREDLGRARELAAEMHRLLDTSKTGRAGEWAQLRAKATPLLLDAFERVARVMIAADFASPREDYPTLHAAIRGLQAARPGRRVNSEEPDAPEVPEPDPDRGDRDPGGDDDPSTPA